MTYSLIVPGRWWTRGGHTAPAPPRKETPVMKLEQRDRELLVEIVADLSIAILAADSAPRAHLLADDNGTLVEVLLSLGRLLHDTSQTLGRRALELRLDSALDSALEEILGDADPGGKPGT